MNDVLLESEHISVDFAGGYSALKDVSLVLKEGETVTVYGLGGAGKTTLLRAVAGLEDTSGGRIYLYGKPIAMTPPEKRETGYTFLPNALKESKRAEDVLSYPMLLRGLAEDDVRKRLQSISHEYDIDLKSKVKDLDAFARARLVLARFFCIERKIYLADDITEGLTAEQKIYVYSCLYEKLKGKAALVATDDEETAKKYGKDNLLILSSGRSEGQGTLDSIAQRPLGMSAASICGYGLYTGLLTRKDKEYLAVIDEENIVGKVPRPISDVYDGKRVCFAVKDGKVCPYYYDLSSEKIISEKEK